MESLACLNGELMPVDQARVPVLDRGFLFGDAVYEVMRLYQGRCWLEMDHAARLRRSLGEMEIQGVDFGRLAARVQRAIEVSEVREGTVYIHITRGVAPRAHVFPDPPVPPTELIVILPYDDAPIGRLRASGVNVLSHPDLRWKRCDVKSTNLLANVLACQAAQRAGCFEAILFGEDGQVTEATHTSVLWVRGGRLEGTPNGTGILPGMTRQLVLRLVKNLSLPWAESRITLDELRAAEEVLLVGTTMEVLPVVRIDGAAVSEGRPGPVARRLQDAYLAAIEHWLSA